jgi:hypothetical protein
MIIDGRQLSGEPRPRHQGQEVRQPRQLKARITRVLVCFHELPLNLVAICLDNTKPGQEPTLMCIQTRKHHFAMQTLEAPTPKAMRSDVLTALKTKARPLLVVVGVVGKGSLWRNERRATDIRPQTLAASSAAWIVASGIRSNLPPVSGWA